VPIPAGQVSPERPVSQISLLPTGILRTGRWRPQPTGHEGTANPTFAGVLAVENEYAIYRDTGVVVTRKGERNPAAKKITDFLKSRTKHGELRGGDNVAPHAANYSLVAK